MEKAENLKKLLLEEKFKNILKPKKKELDMKKLIDNLPDDVEETYKPSAMREYVLSLDYTKATGIINEEAIFETLASFKRAGANAIVTYFADEVAKKLK